jgi:hypothetical protein
MNKKSTYLVFIILSLGIFFQYFYQKIIFEINIKFQFSKKINIFTFFHFKFFASTTTKKIQNKM